MKKRVITGIIYVIVLIGLVAMKWLVPDGWGALGFDALFTAVSVIGCIELLKALKEEGLPFKAIAISFCAVIVPLYAAAEIASGQGWIAALICAVVYAIILTVFHFTFGDKGRQGHHERAVRGGLLRCAVLSADGGQPFAKFHPRDNFIVPCGCAYRLSGVLHGSDVQKMASLQNSSKNKPQQDDSRLRGRRNRRNAGAILTYFIYYRT